jgi:tight adherence protein B
VIPFLLAIVFTVGVLVAYDGLTRSDGHAPRARRKWRRVDQAEAFLRQAGVEGVRVRDFLVVCAAAGIFLGLVAQFVLGWPLVSLVAAALGSVVPLAYLAPRRERRRSQVQVALVDLAAQLRAAIQAGYSIQEGLSQLAYADRSKLGPELQRLALDMRLKGQSVALAAFRDRLADPLADQIVAALLLNDRLGGKQMGAVLSRLAEATRQELSVQQEAKARQGQAVLSARVVAVVPGVVLVGMRLLSPDFMAVYDQPLGQLVLVGCVGWVLLGYGTMRWLGRLPRDSRVLVR